MIFRRQTLHYVICNFRQDLLNYIFSLNISKLKLQIGLKLLKLKGEMEFTLGDWF